MDGFSDERRRSLTPAMWFDNQYVMINNSSGLSLGNSPFSVEFDIFIDRKNLSHDILIGKKRGSWNSTGFLVRYLQNSAENFIIAHIADGTTFQEIALPLALRTMYHYTFSRFGNVVTTTLNDAQRVLDFDCFAADVDNSDHIALGYIPGWSSFRGVIRNVIIKKVAAVVAQWAGNGNLDACWQDTSGNGYHGTVVDSPERCLIHQQGQVSRTDSGGERYIVR